MSHIIIPSNFVTVVWVSYVNKPRQNTSNISLVNLIPSDQRIFSQLKYWLTFTHINRFFVLTYVIIRTFFASITFNSVIVKPHRNDLSVNLYSLGFKKSLTHILKEKFCTPQFFWKLLIIQLSKIFYHI